MQASTIKTRFNEVFKNQKNIMTPNVLRYGKRGEYLYELSAGASLVPGKTIYGVTVIGLKGGHRHDLSKCFDSKELAEEHINSLDPDSKTAHLRRH